MRYKASLFILGGCRSGSGAPCGQAKMLVAMAVFCKNLNQSRFAVLFCFVFAKHRSQTGGRPPSFAPTFATAARQPPAQTYRTCVYVYPFDCPITKRREFMRLFLKEKKAYHFFLAEQRA